MSKPQQRWFRTAALIMALGMGFALLPSTALALGSTLSPSIRSSALAQARQAAKQGGEVCLSSLLNTSLPAYPVNGMQAKNFAGIKGNISLIVGGRNYTAADVDLAEVPFYTVNGPGLTPLLHDGGEWPGTNGNTDTDDGRSSFSVDWAGEFYDLDKNGHYPKAVLRYVGNHCYIFVPPMFFPTLPKGISSSEETTPAAKPEWGMAWPDTLGWGGDTYYFAPATGAKTLEPRFVLGADKNLARLKLKEMADEFDSVIYPKMREYFGVEPDVDADAKVFIILDDIRDGVGSFRGYFWAANQYPRTQIPTSNEKELLHIDLFPTFVLNAKQGYRTTAHEFVHMIHFNEGTSVVDGELLEEERWLEEGFTQYGQYLYDKSHTTNIDEFIKEPDTILVEPRTSVWLGNSPFANYGASYLFMFYIMEKYGRTTGATFMRNLVRDKSAGITSINNALRGFNKTMEDVFADWAISNFLDKTRKLDMSPLNDGFWGYDVDNDFDTTNNLGVNQALPVKFSERVILTPKGTARSANVNPWAADYIEMSGSTGNLNVGFDGDDRSQFKAAIIKRGPQIDPAVEYIYLNEKQYGNLIIQNYGAGNPYENLVLVPMVTANANYERMNYVYSGTFDDLKVALFPNPIFENFLHIVVRNVDKFSSTPRLQMTFGGEQGYLVMTAVNDSTYITNYALKTSGEGLIEAFGTNSYGTILNKNLRFTAVYYPPKSEGLLKASFAALDVPATAFTQGGWAILSEAGNAYSYEGLQALTPTVDVGLPGGMAAAPIKIRLPVKNGSNGLEGRIGLYEGDESGVRFVGAAVVDGTEIVGAVRTNGSYFAAADVTPPVLETTAEPDSPGTVAVGCDEKGSGIDPASIRVTYEGTVLAARYDAAGKRLLITTSHLLDGRYAFEASVADKAGNIVTQRIAADVSGAFALAQVVTWPNPAKAFAMLRGAFTGPDATALQVQATVRDSTGAEVFWTRLENKGSGRYETRWNLRNGDGDDVANGVYFIELHAQSPAGEIKERRKLAVLR